MGTSASALPVRLKTAADTQIMVAGVINDANVRVVTVVTVIAHQLATSRRDVAIAYEGNQSISQGHNAYWPPATALCRVDRSRPAVVLMDTWPSHEGQHLDKLRALCFIERLRCGRRPQQCVQGPVRPDDAC